MNKIFYTLLIAFVSILTFTACDREAIAYGANDKDTSKPEFQGTLNLQSLTVGVIPDNQTGVVLTRSDMDLSSFIVSVYNENSITPIKSWTYASMPEVFTLAVGSYRIDVNSHEPENAEWDKAHYFASQAFDINKDKLQDLGTMICKMRSIKTSVVFTDDLKVLLGNDIEVDVTANNKGKLTYNSTTFDSSNAYYKADTDKANILKTVLRGTIDGQSRSITNIFTGVNAGEHRIIQYSLKSAEGDTGEGGNAGFVIQIVAECDTINHDVNVDPGTDEGINDFDDENGGGTGGGDTGGGDENSPSIVGTSFAGSPFNIDDTKVVRDSVEVIVTLGAPKGITNVIVTIDSETLTKGILEAVNLTDQFDLAYPGQYKTGLEGLGFPTGSDVIDETVLLFNISQFTPLLGIYGAGTHKFIIEVKDKDGVSAKKTLTLKTL